MRGRGALRRPQLLVCSCFVAGCGSALSQLLVCSCFVAGCGSALSQLLVCSCFVAGWLVRDAGVACWAGAALSQLLDVCRSCFCRRVLLCRSCLPSSCFVAGGWWSLTQELPACAYSCLAWAECCFVAAADDVRRAGESSLPCWQLFCRRLKKRRKKRLEQRLVARCRRVARDRAGPRPLRETQSVSYLGWALETSNASNVC